jgi:fimbrial chaperone protein
MFKTNQTAAFRSRSAAVSNALLTGFSVLLLAGYANAQSLKVSPVNIKLAPGQRATTLTVTNDGAAETSIQIRTYAWDQRDGHDNLTASDEVLTSPPVVTIPAGGTQVIRLVLRHSPEGRESTYRILLNQIPAPSQPGIVQIVLSMSIPIFAQTPARTPPHLQFHVEHESGQSYLVALNDGPRHEVVRDVVLSTSDGRELKTDSNASPYVLAGATRRWHIDSKDSLSATSGDLRLRGHGDVGAIDQKVPIVAMP